jgi:hypothetical protein
MKRGTYYLNNKGRWQLYIYKYNKFRRNICILSPSIPSSILLCDLRKQRRGNSKKQKWIVVCAQLCH